ncbi:MAG: hypothetical protein LBS77_06145 [Desulfovibrio sp.]|nr:hypothetical protein [Desulfovibrio sp.]
MKNFIRLTARAGRIALDARVIRAGADIQCVLTGGGGHIGAVALAQPSPAGVQSLILSLPGHREDELALRMALVMAKTLNHAICVSAGIHFDNITREEIAAVLRLTDELTERCLKSISRRKG